MFKVLDEDRMAMLEESIDMILGIWASDPPYEFRGKYWDFGGRSPRTRTRTRRSCCPR